MNGPRTTVVAGIVGWPVSHSLSPRLHAFWLREHGLDGAYVPLPVSPDRLSCALWGLRAAGFAGVSVTLPHKEAAFALAHELDAPAQAAGAVNLLLFREGRFEGRNTDTEGLAASLLESLGSEAIEGKVVVVLGAGGAARAAALAADRLHAREIRILSRAAARARGLMESLQGRVSAALHSFPWGEWSVSAPGARLLINATSAGMKGGEPLDIPLDAFFETAAVCDLVYNPLETHLLKHARERGLRTVDGLGMLMHQAVFAFAAFYCVEPKVTPALRADLEQALRNGG